MQYLSKAGGIRVEKTHSHVNIHTRAYKKWGKIINFLLTFMENIGLILSFVTTEYTHKNRFNIYTAVMRN